MAEQYYWITAVEPETQKPYLLAGGRTEEEARQKGMELLGGLDFQIKRLATRNLARASSLLKGNRLEETHSLKRAAERLGHGKSAAKLRERLDRKRGLR
jgi:hypothetical protein